MKNSRFAFVVSIFIAILVLSGCGISLDESVQRKLEEAKQKVDSAKEEIKNAKDTVEQKVKDANAAIDAVNKALGNEKEEPETAE